MAATVEIEYLVNCSVCFCEFDDDVRKPKFLPCAHTTCLSCLISMSRGRVLTCPLCRQACTLHADGPAGLPNNIYALQLKTKEAQYQAMRRSLTPRWCLTCSIIAKVECLIKEHISISVSPNSLELMSSFMHELKHSKAASRAMLNQALEERCQLSHNLMLKHQSAQLVVEQIEQEMKSNGLSVDQIALMQLQDEEAEITESFDLNAIVSELAEDRIMIKLNQFKTDLNRTMKASQELLHEAITAASLYKKSLPSGSNCALPLLFKMAVAKLDGQVKREVLIRPTFQDRNFLRLLGEFCGESLTEFKLQSMRAKADVFVLLPISDFQYQPEVDDHHSAFNESDSFGQILDVAIKFTATNSPSGTKLMNASFLFPLKKVGDVSDVLGVKLFGQVIHQSMLKTIACLSWITKKQRGRYTVTFETIYSNV